MTLNEVGRGLSKYKAEVLRTFLQRNGFIFLGYRCMDEFDINEVLLKTKSDKPVVYFQYTETPEYRPEQGLFPLVISDRNSLEVEKNQEGQDRGIIHTNDLLLGRPEAYKVVGNPQNFMREIYQSIAKPNLNHDEQRQLDRDYNTFSWAHDINNDKKRLFFGRLLLHLGLWDDAIKCLSKIEGEISLKARAKHYIGDAWRETEEERGYEEAIKSYQDSWQLFEQIGDLSSSAVAKADMANVMRLAKKSISDVEEYVKDAKQILEREILSGYAATLNILGLIYYQKRFEEEWRRGYWLEVADNLCEKSMRVGEIIGDQARIARAGNALSLVLNDQADLHHDRDKIIKAINLLESILPGREAAADLRLCFQINRNLGVTHKTKISLAETEAEKEEEQKISEKYFTESRKYAEIGKERVGQRLETIYREGMLYFELGDQSKAISLFEEYTEKQEIPDRKATGLRFLGLARSKSGKNEQAFQPFAEMVCIYEEMIDTQREDLKGNPDRKRMAKENLSEAIDFFGHNGDNFMMQIVRKLINLIEND
jgi:tetratricopeptide (TPR) repeat protein